MSFSITTDSPANLPLNEVCRRGIIVIPLSYYINGTEHICHAPEGYNIHDYFQSLRQKTEVSTSMIPPQRFVDYWEPLLQAGQDVLFISLSSGISSSYSSALIAAEQMKEAYPGRTVRVIDSLCSSLGEGLLVLRAFSLRSQGMNLEETANTLLTLRLRICHIFTVDDLMFLNRGGRLSGTAAVLGTVLQIKPLLKGNETGHIVLSGKARGRSQSIKALAQRYEELVAYPGDQVVGIAHGNCPEDAETLAHLISQNKPPKELILTCFDPINAAHAGPGAIALFFESDETVRYR